jgi:glyoxylase-like metal-dependent hydrolase (beta-lactamase superfamily II)
MTHQTIRPDQWYETLEMAHGITLIHEPWMPPFFRCNMWLIEGRDRDLLVDAGLGAIPLRPHVPRLNGRPITLLVSHTHWDHVGAAAEFEDRLVHPAEAAVLADPADRDILFDKYRSGARDSEMFTAPPEGWNAASALFRPAPATGLVREGDRIDLGGRSFTVLHTPGHSPGHLSLFEERTGVLIAQDVVYDGPLVDTCFHSDIALYRQTMRRLRDEIRPSIVHGGHFASFGPVRYGQLIDAYLDKTEPKG